MRLRFRIHAYIIYCLQERLTFLMNVLINSRMLMESNIFSLCFNVFSMIKFSIFTFFPYKYIIFHFDYQIQILIYIMFCCFSATKKDKNQVVKRTTEQKRGKVYLSFRPELRFQLDQTFNWAFLGSQQRRTPDQQAKQIEQMRKKQKQMEQEINSKLQQKKKLQKQRQQLQDQLSKLQQENAKKRVAVAVLNYVNLREQCQIQQYRLKL